MLRINNEIENQEEITRIKYFNVKLNGSAEMSVEGSFERDLLHIKEIENQETYSAEIINGVNEDVIIFGGSDDLNDDRNNE